MVKLNKLLIHVSRRLNKMFNNNPNWLLRLIMMSIQFLVDVNLKYVTGPAKMEQVGT